MMPAISVIGDEENFNQLKEQYGFDNDDITWGELEELIKSKQEEANAADTPESSDAPETSAEPAE